MADTDARQPLTGMSVGVESAYHLSRSHRMAIVGRGHDLELDWLSTTLGLRLYFAGAGQP